MIDAGSVTFALPSAGQQDTRISNLTVGGAAVALGSLCVVVTSVLYALSPPAAALPTQPFDLASALAGAVAGGRTLSAAGTIGIFSDIVMAVGALLVGVDHARRGRALAAAGWSAILLSIVVFIFVDAIAGYVLVPTAAMGEGAAAFAASKHLFDVLFLLGTLAFGAGAVLALMADMQCMVPLVSRYVASVGVLAGLLGVLAAAACFIGFPLQQGAGISIGLGAAVFTAIGVQIALRAR